MCSGIRLVIDDRLDDAQKFPELIARIHEAERRRIVLPSGPLKKHAQDHLRMMRKSDQMFPARPPGTSKPVSYRPIAGLLVSHSGFDGLMRRSELLP